ncbi:UDP-glucose 6-dehydrogenase [Bacillus cereus]|uniref:UDP-glucose dehydrogenase family protein n=1 Tax=Bacillus TaxID=1386 RepID=UPI0005DAEACE|nr:MULTISPECIES: UDP-glucose/GDP-mannose dehydrogenase family protein [Bacillus]CGG06685.1 UDP-glucose 6-dehydrogenase [Streptococcus pneumoniae]MBR9688308.1 UDP-glucose 6-dehydrogenase [Bacillus cereus]MEB9967518.1 UDP-glucose/GDP-mannose dehydrogenase family protein [Bacillus cereus]TNP05223.1 UDP-glucose/GDP-mannose dehydrogenase family protein [Bacillus cereus]UNT67124.1 UDP-glucose/GDP-mannose dehydrogenase family protein [Bacillus sp. N447-1]
MKILVVGTGYVGLVSGVSLAEIGHNVTCLDIDEMKVHKLREGISPIYEPGIEKLIKDNLDKGTLSFEVANNNSYRDADVIYIAVGTPEKEDGSANLSYIYKVCEDIANSITKNVVIVVKSTVPVGTNHKIKAYVEENLSDKELVVQIVSNPEFLREGSAIEDVFNGDRIVIGADNKEAGKIIEEINKPFNTPIYMTNINSAEMIKYASNAFLATKISFINEIANVCEKVGADVESVAYGMGLDSRVGNQFLKAGLGYGGSCFPKDTKALRKIAENVDYDFSLLSAVIEFNNKQQRRLLNQAIEDFGTLKGKSIGILGLAFKPNTDDIREAASLAIIPELIEMGAEVKAYDPVAIENAKKVLSPKVRYFEDPIETIKDTDAVFILTEWNEIKSLSIESFVEEMKIPNIYDGRNCFDLENIEEYKVNYYSIGRKNISRIDRDILV